MPIEAFPCPECGAEVEMGLPREATVQSVTAETDRDRPTLDTKGRELSCPNGHRFAVYFEP